MAAKAVPGLHVPEFPPECLVERFGLEPFIPGSHFQSVNRRVVTDQAFVVDVVAFEDPSLGILAEGPADGERDGSRSIADRIHTLPALSLDEVGESPRLKRQLGVRKEGWIFPRELESATHGGL